MVLAASFSNKKPFDHKYDPHTHSNYELLYFLDGGVEYSVQGEIYYIQSHTLLIIPPHCEHSAKIILKKDYRRILFRFDQETLNQLWDGFNNAAPLIVRIPINSPIDTLFKIYLDKWNKYSELDKRNFEEGILNLCLVFAKNLDNDARIVSTTQAKQRLYAIVDYIYEHPQEEITLSSLEKLFSVSQSYLTHNLKKEIGVSVSELITKSKIFYAHNRILLGIRPSVIARECGYEDYSTFYRQYKKIIGHSPSFDYDSNGAI